LEAFLEIGLLYPLNATAVLLAKAGETCMVEPLKFEIRSGRAGIYRVNGEHLTARDLLALNSLYGAWMGVADDRAKERVFETIGTQDVTHLVRLSTELTSTPSLVAG
jgi:hypothetical protein